MYEDLYRNFQKSNVQNTLPTVWFIGISAMLKQETMVSVLTPFNLFQIKYGWKYRSNLYLDEGEGGGVDQ